MSNFGHEFIVILQKAFFLISLVILPGSWITFGLPLNGLSYKVKLLLGSALSPAVIALQYFVLRFLGLSFSQTAVALFIINLFAILLLVRQARLISSPHLSKTFFWGSLVLIFIAGIVLLPWITIPNYRPFAWHALMHSDIVYQIVRSTQLIPEEPELAGLVLSYTWTGDIFWSILGWLSNWAPTAAYPFTNLVWLVIAFMLAYELAKDGFELPISTSVLSAGFLFTGTGIVATVAWLIAGDRNRWTSIFGNVQLTAFLNKYRGFEVILFAFALLIGIALVTSVGMRRKIRFIGILLACLLTAVGLLYPILFPMGGLLVGGFILALLTRWPRELPDYDRKDLLLTIVCLGISVLIFLAFLFLTTKDRTGVTFQLVQSGRKAKTLQAISSLIFFWVLSIPFVVKSIRRRHGPTVLFILTAASMMVLYIFTYVFDLEYKFILVATIALAPLAAASVAPLMMRLPRGQWAIAILVPFIFGCLNLTFLYRIYATDPWGGLIPPNLRYAPPITEDSFWVKLNPQQTDAGWINAVRETTPEDTIVVAHDSRIHLGPFLDRSLYSPSDQNGQATSGYSVNNEAYLLEQRGYSEDLWQKRIDTMDSLYKSGDSAGLQNVLQNLLSLHRPIAILFTDRSTPALSWFKKEKIGSQLYADNAYTVWFIDGATSLSVNDQ